MIKLHFSNWPRGKGLPSKASLQKLADDFAKATLPCHLDFEATLAFLPPAVQKDLNSTYRGMNKPTNVLSFPQHTPRELKKVFTSKTTQPLLYLGDVLLCLKVIKDEARRDKKPLNHHVMHLVVHGLLHLLGYDHVAHRQARVMEALEKVLLRRHGVADPYVLREPAPKRQKSRIKGRRKKL